MIIDDVDALKSWLAKLLEPICDVDPSALANYVVALVKKHRPEKELRALCADQLDVFLQKETTGFVDTLFECLTTKNYLGNPAAKEEIKIPVQKLEEKEETGHVEDDRDNRRRKSPLRNRSDFNKSRVRDDRRRNDRKRRELDRHGKSGESYRERRGGSSRGRSYSRSRSRSRSSSRGKSREREHNPRRAKGFCIRGDLCPFDHGNDPLIVDDVTLPTMIPFPPPPGLSRMPMPPMTEQPPGMPMSPPPHGQPPPPGIYPMPDSYDPEAYYPESPALTGPGRAQYRHFIPLVQTQRPNLIGLTSGDGQNSRAANIVIQTELSVPSVSSIEMRYNSEQKKRKRCLLSANGPQVKKLWMDKQNLNNQHKPTFPKKIHYVKTKLEVRKIPRELNNITKLIEHFSKFGTIVNIQVLFGGDPEAALIQYTANDEAQRAISSSEAVLNNRFIRVHWHKEATSSTQQQGPSQNTNPGQQQPTTHKVINKQPPAASYVLNKSFPKHQTATGATGIMGSTEPTSPSQEPSVGLTPHSSLQKGPFSRTVSKTASKSLGKTGKVLEAQEVLKKKQEVLKLQQDMRKKKQEMLEKQIDCQKMMGDSQSTVEEGQEPGQEVQPVCDNPNCRAEVDELRQLVDSLIETLDVMNQRYTLLWRSQLSRRTGTRSDPVQKKGSS